MGQPYITVADIFKYKTPKLLAERIYQRNNIIRWLSEPDTSKPLMIFIHPSCAGSEVYQDLEDKLSQAYQCLGIDNYNLSHENNTILGALPFNYSKVFCRYYLFTYCYIL